MSAAANKKLVQQVYTDSANRSGTTFIDNLATLEGITDPYLTTATDGSGGVSYALSLKITSAALCGRFTTACDETGGN